MRVGAWEGDHSLRIEKDLHVCKAKDDRNCSHEQL